MRQERDLLLRIPLLGDIDVDDDCATAAQRRLGQRNDAPVLQLVLESDRRRIELQTPGPASRKFSVSTVAVPFFSRCSRMARTGVPGSVSPACKPIHRRIFRITDDQALLVIEHREALRHALQGGIEAVTRSPVQRPDHAVDDEQRQSRQHDAGEDGTQQQQIGLVGKRLDIVARLQADIGILLVQPLQLLLDIGYPILQLRRVRSEVMEIGNGSPDVPVLPRARGANSTFRSRRPYRPALSPGAHRPWTSGPVPRRGSVRRYNAQTRSARG